MTPPAHPRPTVAISDADSALTDEKVGYGRPPRSGQFKAGNIPHNKKPSAETRDVVRTRGRVVLDEQTLVIFRGKQVALSRIEVALRANLTKALNGDDAALRPFIKALMHNPEILDNGIKSMRIVISGLDAKL